VVPGGAPPLSAGFGFTVYGGGVAYLFTSNTRGSFAFNPTGDSGKMSTRQEKGPRRHSIDGPILPALRVLNQCNRKGAHERTVMRYKSEMPKQMKSVTHISWTRGKRIDHRGVETAEKSAKTTENLTIAF